MLKHQSGQALALGLVVLGALSLGLIAMFQTSLLLQGKSKLQLASDATAYSLALLEARSLNHFAYTNRTQLAHQVAMAHLTTLASWASFGDTEAQRLVQSNPPLWTITQFFGAHGAAYASSAKARGARTQYAQTRLAHAIMLHDQAVHDVLKTAQFNLKNQLLTMQQALIKKVMQEFYPNQIPPTVTIEADDWQQQLIQRSGRVDWQPFLRDVQTLYPFLGERNHVVKSLPPVSTRCPHLRHELRRQGSTRLSSEGQWISADSQSWHALRSNRFIGCYYREYPMGYGVTDSGAVHDSFHLEYTDDAPSDFSEQDFWRWAQANTQWDIFAGNQNPLANSWAVRDKTRWNGRGLPNYINVKNHQPFNLHIRVSHHQARSQAASNALRNAANNVGVSTMQADSKMTVSSRAQAYYQVPESTRADATQTNVYMAFWQARLLPDDMIGKE